MSGASPAGGDPSGGRRGAAARRLRAFGRLGRAAVVALRGLLTVVVRFPKLDDAGRMREVQRWSRQMLAAFGVGLVVEGGPYDGARLVAANHVSWLDILALDAVRPARFVAKAEIRRWPVLGLLVGAGGTLYLTREHRRDALRVVHAMAAALAAGDVLAVFPEGTTGDGRALLPFHANLLQAAIATGTPVQPVALRYADARHAVSPAVEFVGATTLWQTLWNVAVADGLEVHVVLLAPERSAGRGRRELAQALHRAIGAALDDGLAAGPGVAVPTPARAAVAGLSGG